MQRFIVFFQPAGYEKTDNKIFIVCRGLDPSGRHQELDKGNVGSGDEIADTAACMHAQFACTYCNQLAGRR